MDTSEAPPDADVVALRQAQPAGHQHPRTGTTGRTRRRVIGGLLAVLAVAGAAIGAGMLTGFLPNPVVAGDPNVKGHDEPATRSGPTTVKAVRPKQDPSVQVKVEQLGTVEAYYRADLRARAPDWSGPSTRTSATG